MSKSPFGFVYLAVDEPKGDPTQGEEGLNSPRPTYTSGRTRTDT
jgi:hypothetical protein